MNYFVTGATGFIGRFLVGRLLKREDSRVFALVRSGSEYKLDALRRRLGVDADRLVAIQGDINEKLLGVSKRDQDDLNGQVDHFFHLAAIYDLTADENTQRYTNIEGTRQTLKLAEKLEAGCFHHVSSIAAAGLYNGTFTEDMFEEATGLDDPYLLTKHESEALVRQESKLPWRIYRPSMVVGHSETGEMDKIDGPYYMFKLIQKLKDVLPNWMPLIGVEGGHFNVVPVDFVADALDHIAHQPDHDGQCFHLTADRSYNLGELMDIIAGAAQAPRWPVKLDNSLFNAVPGFVKKGVSAMTPKLMVNTVLENLDIPPSALQFLTFPTEYDNQRAREALAGSNIEVPDLEGYIQQLWDFWENHLDPDRGDRKDELQPLPTLPERVDGKVVMVTGATSGIGKATALKLARAGATVLVIARTAEKLEETLHEIDQLGGTAQAYSCDVSDLNSVDDLIQQVIADHGHVDVLVNNAGRSIRRSVVHSFDRFHDYERTMQLNYFGALRLIMQLMPGMIERGGGHVINISSIGVLTNAPRFSAYVASKAALDAFTRCASSELAHEGIRFTTINMPLVRTPMIAPTKIYNHVPTISPAQAADMICDAIVRQPKRIATNLGVMGQVMHFLTPKVTETIMNTGYKLFSDSSAALGDKESSPKKIRREQAAFSRLFKGIHW
ncbi:MULTISPECIES: SDR family oxidoreductase [unclassified Alcanivorax]|jgi:NAD(P)-dependent dehydrogenase (short-subunit alcohol dehydrogenase family)|uniref:SDR family oxidoreductase n=3 Tax=Alcanivorax TaxID=59753 RepID=UPI000789D0DE|nr:MULTISPECIES: SDR family oxidoreductase [unclassified Alcanivorax]KZX78514.1 short chain dehydrogenase [Alcanivorax sp. HI0013]KZY11850.1 short chain dehydrogenase [Alcanivorax sp. HI0035]MED5239559.1 SDR family oxidoreductase [Pseudomonadota bacterium]MBB10764.1 short chain dehydrogenase [Alcanivorax sp.]MEE2601436.1 SDR family oxidoreductase [Pseudomonadota bacterium]